MSERFEFVDRRVLGALRIVDVAGRRPILRPLHIVSDTLRFTLNRSGLHVITGAPGFGEYTRVFDLSAAGAPAAPASRSFTIRVEDPAHEYQSRSFSITLPRDPQAPARGAQTAAGSLFAIEEIEMLPAVAAPTAGTDAVIRIRALRSDDQLPFINLLVRAAGAGDKNGWGMTDANGEALVAVPGLQSLSETGGTLTEHTALALTFIQLPPPSNGSLPNWREFAATPGRPAQLRASNGTLSPATLNATPGREFHLTAIVTPAP